MGQMLVYSVLVLDESYGWLNESQVDDTDVHFFTDNFTSSSKDWAIDCLHS